MRGPVVEKTEDFSKSTVCTKERQSNHDRPSIFCARNRGSLLDDDDDDKGNEDEWTLRKANPIYEGDDEDCFRPHHDCHRPLSDARQSNCQPIFLRWDQTRLSEDEIMGYYLGGLIRV